VRTGLGTGFFVGTPQDVPILVTNKHVLDPQLELGPGYTLDLVRDLAVPRWVSAADGGSEKARMGLVAPQASTLKSRVRFLTSSVTRSWRPQRSDAANKFTSLAFRDHNATTGASAYPIGSYSTTQSVGYILGVGGEYDEYRRQVPRVIPRLRPWMPGSE
jgi:hypothetical protein